MGSDTPDGTVNRWIRYLSDFIARVNANELPDGCPHCGFLSYETQNLNECPFCGYPEPEKSAKGARKDFFDEVMESVR